MRLAKSPSKSCLQVLKLLHHQENACFIGEAVGIEVGVDNTKSKYAVTEVIIRLIENTFMSHDSGESRTFQRILQIWSIEGVNAGDRKRTE